MRCELREDKLKHLEFIQNVISRMNANSFLIKGWMVTLVSALFALAAGGSDARYVIVIYIAIPAFWGLDAFYLSQERQYRRLYDAVREQASTDFSMDVSSLNSGRDSWFCALFSKTVITLYLFVLVVAILAMFWLWQHPATR